jgi:hypothetical protein
MISLGPQAANWGQPQRPDNTGRRIEPGTCLDPGHAARASVSTRKGRPWLRYLLPEAGRVPGIPSESIVMMSAFTPDGYIPC